MAEYNVQEKFTLNHTVALCLENRFNEAHRCMLQQAGLSQLNGTITTPEIRKIINERIKQGVAPAVSGEMLRIENTFLYIRDIEQYNQEQAQSIISNLDQTLPLLNEKNNWIAMKKMENIFHLSGQPHIYHELGNYPKAIDKVRLLNRKLKNKKEPILTPAYFGELKKRISNEAIKSINKELEAPQSNAERIHLNKEKIYLIDNSGWSRNQRFLAKSETYHKLANLYNDSNEPEQAQDAVDKRNQFMGAYKKTIQFSNSFKQNKNYEDWLCK